MKKLLLLVALVAFSFSVYAQTGFNSALVKAGYQTDAKRFGVGVEGRYSIMENVRIAPEVTFFFPKNHTMGLDVNVNAHYVLPLQDGFSIYPLAGFAMINNRYSNDGNSNSNTDFGFNLGAGAEYSISPKNFLNLDFKYTFTDHDFGVIMLGYGFRF
ncbi:porin family protein [Dysgonomonas sp. ZJ709]|uniref:porin family protein n=1 Tax=Dysgonomonas sp. ZJ709 TaxID=2709797 RepID=UPI0013EC5A83|nr:porin family protein [Dysgonomonas sp. ZJ709]